MSSPATVPSEEDARESPHSMPGSLSESPAPSEGQACYLCGAKYKSPKILSCLHVFCQPCLEDSLNNGDEEKPSEGNVSCPQCQQVTALPANSASELPSDLVMVNMLDMTAVQERQIICTSCKAREKAVARCADCATFLCPNCVTAHQYMRCFDNHKVESFDELSSDENFALHKPIFCSSHPKEFMNLFCNSCQVPVCNECVVRGAHAQGDHVTERIADAEAKVKDELKVLMAESKGKLTFCGDATNVLQNSLSDIQMQRDDAKSLIQETFQSYKAMLEKRQEDLLTELDELHSEQELSIMELIHNIDQTMTRIEDGCQFTERILEKGSGVEILLMKKLIYTQLLTLINNTPKAEPVAKLEFHSDSKEFEDSIKRTFGSFRKEELPQTTGNPTNEIESTIQSPLQSSFENEAFSLPSGMLRDDDHEPSSLSPLSTSDFAQHLQNIPMALNMPVSHPSPPNLTSMPPPIGGTTIGGLTDAVRSYSRNSHSPAMSDSGVSLDASSGGSGTNTPQVNLATLAKMGNLTINNQGHISLNGQILPGFNINTMPQLTNMIPKPQPPANVPTSMGVPTSIGAPTPIVGGGNPNPMGHAIVGPNTMGVSNSMGGHSDGMTSPLASHLDSLVNNTDNLHMGTSLNLDSLASQASVTGTGAVQSPALDTLASLLHQQAAAAGATSSSGSQINTFMPAGSSSGSLTPTSGMFNSDPSPRASVMTVNGGVGQPGGPGGPGGLAAVMGNGTGAMDTFSADGQNGQNPPFPRRSGKVSAMQIRCKFGQLGPGKGQFNSPHGFCMGLDEDIIVADTNNHRIQIFEKTGEFKYQFGIPGREEGQLWYPRKVAVMRNSGKFVVCDRGNERSRMQIFTKNGHFIKKIAIRYIDIVAGLAITPQGHIVAVDSVSPTVFCIAESGDLIRWFDCSDYMREPSDIAIAGKEYFVCDFKGHCVVVFSEEGQFLRRIGCENITNFPNGIDISDAGDVLIGDSHGNRFHVAVFQRDGSLIGEFECPYVKVSRCCGLNITSEGYIVTLAKNNHHVLVLNTLYIT